MSSPDDVFATYAEMDEFIKNDGGSRSRFHEYYYFRESGLSHSDAMRALQLKIGYRSPQACVAILTVMGDDIDDLIALDAMIYTGAPDTESCERRLNVYLAQRCQRVHPTAAREAASSA